MSVDEHRRIFNKMVAFIRQIDIRYKCFCIEKKHISDVVEATGKLSRQISSVFNALLPNPIFRKVMPSEYKLFQAADLFMHTGISQTKNGKQYAIQIREDLLWKHS